MRRGQQCSGLGESEQGYKRERGLDWTGHERERRHTGVGERFMISTRLLLCTKRARVWVDYLATRTSASGPIPTGRRAAAVGTGSGTRLGRRRRTGRAHTVDEGANGSGSGNGVGASGRGHSDIRHDPRPRHHESLLDAHDNLCVVKKRVNVCVCV